MKPSKTLHSVIGMIAFVLSVAFIAGCQKDTSVNNFALTDSVAADGYSGGMSARAGSDQVISATSTTLDGSRSAGSIISYSWTKEVGTGGAITSPSNARTTVTGLSTGNYRFRLTVKDSRGRTATDTVHVTVSSGVSSGGGSTATVPPPSVNAGSAQTITLPTSSVNLTGTASSQGGVITSYQWSKKSGASCTIASPSTPATTISGLTAGSYVFTLKATDDKGASATSDVQVTVNSQTTTTPPPTTTGYTLTYSNGFDSNGDLDPDGHGQIGSGSLSTSLFVTGPGAFKSVPSNVSAGIRSEVQFDDTRTASEGAIEYDVYYEVAFQDNGHSLQFHPNTSGGSASPGLWHMGGKFAWVNWKGGTNTYYPTNVTIQTGHWYHVRLEYKFGSAGYLHFYLDGQAVLTKDNIQVGDGSGQYLKVGVNMWQSQSSVVYYDNLKIYKKG